MARPIWKGVVSFGMVSIPVKLYAATDSKDIALHLLHGKCNSRLRQMRWCPVCEREVEWNEVARGYEHTKDQYVVLTDEDFEKLPLPSKHTIELSAFISAEEIDPVYYEKSYYLEPEETGIKPFVLLMRALRERKQAAIGKIAFHNKERLCALRPLDGILILETLLYADEIRVARDTPLPEVKVSEKELAMAFTLMDLLAEPFQPEKYRDNYREALTDIIEAKLRGQELVEVTAAPPGKIIDLMEALKASVEAAKKRKEGESLRKGQGLERQAAAG